MMLPCVKKKKKKKKKKVFKCLYRVLLRISSTIEARLSISSLYGYTHSGLIPPPPRPNPPPPPPQAPTHPPPTQSSSLCPVSTPDVATCPQVWLGEMVVSWSLTDKVTKATPPFLLLYRGHSVLDAPIISDIPRPAGCGISPLKF